MSKKPLSSSFEEIEEAAAAAEEWAGATSDEQRISALESRLAALEPLMEQQQANSKIGPSLTNYVADLRAEQVFFNRARYVVGTLAILLVFALVALLCLAVFHAKSPLLTAPPIAIATFTVGVVSGAVFVLAGFIKGVFRSTAERHADGFLPPALEKTIELYDHMTGKIKGG